MLPRISKQSITALLLISFVIPSSILLYPKKVTAATPTNCVAVVAGAVAAAVGLNSTKETIGVTVGASDAQVNTVTAGGQYGSFYNDCILQPLIKTMAKKLLSDITRQTVDWINSGFKGNPGFATDLGGLLQDAADETIGDFIAKEAPFLCSQFSFQLKIKLAQSQLPYRQKSACTLSSVINNVNGFVDNNGNVGWDNWVQVTTVPQNNAFGAFEIAQDEISKRILKNQSIKTTYLDWGRGFKDWEYCETDPQSGEESCRKETPGSVVQERLSATLNMDLQQIGVAEDINAVLDALTNQLTKQIMEKSFGLLGGSRGPRKSTISASNYAAAATPTSLNFQTGNTIQANINNALISGINAGNASANQQFTEVAPIVIPQTTGASTGITTLGPIVAPQTAFLSVSPISTTVVNDSNPLVFEASFNTNFLSGGLTYRIAFKRTSTLADTAYLNAFSTVNADVILYNGASLNSSITTPGQETIGWADVGTDAGKPFTVRLTAPKKIGVAPGNYTLEIVVYDNNSRAIDSKQHNIIVQ